MPNWCRNRITVYGNDQTEKIKEIEKIFESKTPFNDIFPQPDWKNTPNENGELPVLEQHKHPETGKVVWETYNFQMVQMMTDGIIGALTTGGLSGKQILQVLRCRIMTHSKLNFKPRGVHQREL